jgi:glutamyl-tRNA reductase
MPNRHTIILVGLNHRTAGVEVRERYALGGRPEFERQLLDVCPVREALVLSTCNRVEILAVAPASAKAGLAECLLGFWAEACGGEPEELAPHVYQHEDLAAVDHLFCVAASLDSMVMGEPQILGQLKEAYRAAVDKGAARVVVNRLLHKSFSVAKRVRTETGVASSAVSISFAAVELAKKIFGQLAGKAAMLVGAGEMAELAAVHLQHAGITRLLIANRTFVRAQELARAMNAEPVYFEELAQRLADVDIVISSTGSPTAIIRARDIKAVLKKRRNRPMFFIDIAVPRDIDPDVNALDNVYLYDIDDLQEVVEENLAQRREEAVKAKAIVHAETQAFERWLKSLKLKPTIVDLVSRGDELARRELAKTLKKLGPVDEATRQSLETLVLSVSRKLLHEPIDFLKRRTREEGSAERFIDIVRRIFNLDDDPAKPEAHAERRLADEEAGEDGNGVEENERTQ